jgi:histidinol-phosphate aminotransferase
MLQPRPGIEKLVPGRHGGIDYLELNKLGILPENILDFSVSTNPFGPPPGIKEAINRASIDCYPDSESTELRSLLASKLNISPENLLVGSGSTELIRMVTSAYLGPDDPVIIPQPTYADYEVACHLVDAKVLKQPTQEAVNFKLNVAKTVGLIRKHHPKGIFLCNPNNPTGQYLSREEIKEILSAARDSVVILDEAYVAFTEGAWASTELMDCDNLVILKSMTKDYALAGLRLGYIIAPEPIISALKRIKSPWNVSSVAQAAGVFVLKADGYLDTCRIKIKQAKEFLVEGLKGLGLSPLPSHANFFLVKVGDATKFRQALLKHGIMVRDCTSFDLPNYIRLAPRPIAECQRLLSAIRDTGVCHHVS